MDILIPISFFATVFGALYMYFSTRHKERIALIEKGTDASVFYPDASSTNKRGKFFSLQIGMLAIGIGLGIIMGDILHTYLHLKEEVAYNGMIFLFGGMSLIAFHIVNQRQKAK